MALYVIFLQDILMKQKMNLFYKHEIKNKIKLFSKKKLKFQPRT